MVKQKRWENSIPSIAEGLHKSILSKGYGEISDFLPHSALNDVTNFIKEIKVKTGSGDIRLNEDKTIGTCIENLMSPNVKDLMHEILRNSGISTDKSKYYARVRANSLNLVVKVLINIILIDLTSRYLYQSWSLQKKMAVHWKLSPILETRHLINLLIDCGQNCLNQDGRTIIFLSHQNIKLSFIKQTKPYFFMDIILFMQQEK